MEEEIKKIAETLVWAPFRAELGTADIEQLKDVKVGDTITTQEAVHLKPDFMKASGKDGAYFFAVFINREDCKEAYAKHFSWVQIPLWKCISLVRNSDRAQYVVINVFSKEPTIIDNSIMTAIESLQEDNLHEQVKSHPPVK